MSPSKPSIAPVTVVVGNPKPASRTSTAALTVARAVLDHAGEPGGEVHPIELAELAAVLFTWGDARVGEAKQTVLGSRLLVVASPVYKASFTGLLKAFLDQFGRDELAALATVPLMVGAGAVHNLAIEQQLRPVLIEIGASCPTRGLFIQEDQLETLDDQVGQWMCVWGDVLVATARTRQ
jgi:FMN reductase